MGSQDEKNSAENIKRMFEEVLESVGRMEEGGEESEARRGGSVGARAVIGDEARAESETNPEECEKTKQCEDTEDELLTFPPSGILSPLSKSVEAVVTPLVRAALSCARHLPVT